MLSHKAIVGSLDAYADGTLPDSQRADVAAHLQTCTVCGESLRQIHRLDQVLDDLPPMAAVPFARFWSKLEPRLPSHAKKRAPLFRPARLAAGFALAIVASLVGVVALASDRTMPDSPLYAVKHFRQDVQLNLADARERPRLELALGHQRLGEALAMVHSKRNDLAAASLRDFHALVSDAVPQLKNTTVGQPATDEVTNTLNRLEKQLTTIREAVTQDGPDSGDAEVVGATQDGLNDVSQAETSIETTAPVIESASPSPAIEQPSPAPAPSAEATSTAPSEAPSPEAAAAPSEPAPTDAAASPTP
jgi:hypothetical protein